MVWGIYFTFLTCLPFLDNYNYNNYNNYNNNYYWNSNTNGKSCLIILSNTLIITI